MKKSRKMIPKKMAMYNMVRLKCKLGFLQSKDGHVLSIFHGKKAKPGCKKIKTQMAESFESYYFQNGLKQYHTVGKENGKPAKMVVTVTAGGGELKRVCRKTAPSAQKAKVGPGGH